MPRQATKLTMTSQEIRQARLDLCLSEAQFAKVLETNIQTIERMEYGEDRPARRNPPARIVRLIRAFQRGYRPPDWPKKPALKFD